MNQGSFTRLSNLLGLAKSNRAKQLRQREKRNLLVESLEKRVVFDASYFALSGGSLTQNWSDAALITANDDWSGVPSIVGFLGQELVTATGVDPRTVTGTSVVANDIDVIANQTNPNTLTSGGVAEFAIADPVVAIQGSGTADVPYLQFHLNTTGRTAVRLQANLRDIDGSGDNSIQQINVQYRVGTTGTWTNVTGTAPNDGYYADVTTGPNLATAVTVLDVTLPAATDNQAQVQLRVMTTNAVGNDEWVGIDDIIISSATLGADTTPPTLVSIDDGDVDDNVLISTTLTYTISFNEDIDSTTVSALDFDNAGTAALTIGAITETTATSGVFTVEVTPTTAGTLILRVPTGATIADVAGNNLLVPVQDDTTVIVSATDTTPPTVVSIVDADIDNLVAGGVPLTYTITFSEDIDAATLTGVDFANAGTSSITIGTIAETTPGVFTVNVTPSTSGTLILEIPVGAVIQDVAGNALVVPVQDDDSITVDATAPTLTTIVDNVAGGPASQFQTIIYTLTFSEDIDSTSLTAADFDNAGTSAITIGTITETTATSGIFTVAVVPSTVGTVILRIPSGAVISDVFGNALSVPFSDDTTITVNAITSLTAGDIAFTGIQTDAPDTFSFVLLTNVVAGTSITFTDNGWGSGSFAINTENTVIATFGSAYAPGAHFVISDATTSATFFLVGTTTVAGTTTGNLSGLSAGGDSILAFQGSAPTSDTATNWIAGINTRSFAASPTNTNQSNLPSALTVGVNAIQISNTSADIDNSSYNKTTFSGSVAQIRADVNAIANWSTNDALPHPQSNTVFTVTGALVTPTITATPLTKVYDGTAIAIVATADDGPGANAADTSGFTYTYYALPNLAGASSSTPPKNVGNYSVDVAYAGNASYNSVGSTAFNFSITVASLSVTGLTGANKVYNATTVATVTGTATVTPFGSDDVTLGGTPVFAFGDKNVANAKAITASGYTLSGADATNYSIVQPTGLSANITPFALTGSITAANKVFDGNTSATILTRTLATVFGGDTVSYVGGTGAFASSGVGTGIAVTATGLSLSGADAPNYSVNTTATTSADITAPASTIVTRGIRYLGATGSSASSSLATDKVALLPGQTSSFANYTNYSLGLNGIVVDLNGLPSGTTNAQMLASLQFARWDGIAVAGFVALPGAAVPSASIVTAGGAGSSDRVVISFPDNTVQNTWLRVTVLANAFTGLSANDVFYFGNVIGDFNVGNTTGSTGRIRVNATDTGAVRVNQSTLPNSAPVTNIYDVNRDGRVNATDTGLVRSNQQTLGIVAPITAPAARAVGSRFGNAIGRTDSNLGTSGSLVGSGVPFTGDTGTGVSGKNNLQGSSTIARTDSLLGQEQSAVPGNAALLPVSLDSNGNKPLDLGSSVDGNKEPSKLESIDDFFASLWKLA